jgi:hypothetical protein
MWFCVQFIRYGIDQFSELGEFMLRQKAHLKSKSACLSAAADIRFWLISTKVERNMASTEATMAKVTNVGSNCGRRGTSLS